jgi:hypothetical protein
MHEVCLNVDEVLQRANGVARPTGLEPVTLSFEG